MRKRAIIFFHFSIFSISQPLSGPLAQVCLSPFKRKEKKSKKFALSRDPKSWRLLLLSLRFFVLPQKGGGDTRKYLDDFISKEKREITVSRPHEKTK